MTEHHPDMDLIMALTGGELPPEEAARLESQLDPEARAELEAQRAALAALGALARPAMTPDESRRLRSGIREELGLDPGHVKPARQRRQPVRWFARALPAMAAAASLVAVVAIAVNLTDGGQEESEPPAATEAAPSAAPATAAPATTAAYAEATTTTAAMTEAIVATAADAMEEEPVAEEPMAEEAMAEEAMEEAAMAARDAADEAAAAETAPTTAVVTTVGVTDTTEGEPPADLAFAFATDRPDDAVLFTDSVLAEAGGEAFPLVELADRAAADGLVCWVYVADGADPADGVSFMGYGLIDGEEGEAYRIEPGASLSQQDVDEEPPVILLFAYPDCRPVGFRAG